MAAPSSSLTAAARSRYLLDLLARLPDPRNRRGRRHWLAGLVAVGIAAVTAGSRVVRRDRPAGRRCRGRRAGRARSGPRAGRGVRVPARVRPGSARTCPARSVAAGCTPGRRWPAAGAVIAAGAPHAQGGTAPAITGRPAGSVMTVTASRPALDEQLETLPRAAAAGPVARSGPWCRPGPGSPAPPRSRRPAARSRTKARRPPGSGTALPAAATPVPRPAAGS